MPLARQHRCLELVLKATSATVAATPDWLLRPGKHECRERWNTVCEIYTVLTEAILPDVMPSRERRRVDAVLVMPGCRPAIFEFDETQHFNVHRHATLEAYPQDVSVAFDLNAYKRVCLAKTKVEGGGFASPRPPLFPGEGGRHKQRAFRDALADLLPPLHGFGPTVRIAHFEVEPWLFDDDTGEKMRSVLKGRYPA